MNENDGMGDVYQIFTYLLVIIISCIVMGIWLKRRAKKKK
jgi:hypothetical protein